MSILPNFLRSLLLTTILSFTAPIVFVGGVLAALSIVSYLPGLTVVGEIGATQVMTFLTVFGSGNPVGGVVTIGLTCCLVGGLFDLFNYYRYQNLKG